MHAIFLFFGRMFTFIILVLGFGHGIYLSYALLKSNNKENNANLLLSVFVLIFALLLASTFIDELELNKQLPYLIGIDQSLVFLFGPLFYLYVVRLTSPSYQDINFWHLLPFIIATLGLLPFLMESNEFKISFTYDLVPQNEEVDQYINLYEFIYTFLALGQVYIYLTLIFFRLVKHKRIIRDNYSKIENISLNWLFFITITLTILVFLWCADETIEYNAMLCIDEGIGVLCQVPWTTNEREVYFVEIGIVICIYLISLYGIKQPEIFLHKRIKTNEINNKEDTTDYLIDKSSEKYQNSSLDIDLSLSIFKELKAFLSSSTSYLEPEFSLNQLAEETGISKHHLSQSINQCAKQCFFDFINELRIEQAKELLASDNKMNVLEVSLAAGFNSRSSFYSAFKKYVHMTPSQYRKQQYRKQQYTTQ